MFCFWTLTLLIPVCLKLKYPLLWRPPGGSLLSPSSAPFYSIVFDFAVSSIKKSQRYLQCHGHISLVIATFSHLRSSRSDDSSCCVLSWHTRPKLHIKPDLHPSSSLSALHLATSSLMQTSFHCRYIRSSCVWMRRAAETKRHQVTRWTGTRRDLMLRWRRVETTEQFLKLPPQ